MAYDDEEILIKSGDDASDINGDFLLTISIPKSTTGEHTITVTSSTTTTKAEAKFTVQPQITISPQSGAAGDLITVSGTGFGNRVKFNISFDSLTPVTNALTDSTGSLQVTFTAPPVGEGSHDIKVKDEAGNADTGAFTLAPVAIRLSASNGFVGFEISIGGSGFRNNSSISIMLDNTLVKTATTDDYGQFTTRFNVPTKSGGAYKVKATDGMSTAQADFYLAPNADISPMTTPTSPGYVGTEMTISGTAFQSEKTLSITYDGNQLKTATVNTDGSFSVTFKIPASYGGEHKIIASDGTNTRQFTFIMESTTPPTPAPLKPEMAIKAKAETYFDWADVTDPSGITYTLQIATNKDFTIDSLVLEKTGLISSEYTLKEEESLKPREKGLLYYWHVKTVDSAANESQWTGTGTFYVGFVWSFSPPIIYTILVIIAFLLGVAGFWLGRRTTYH